MSPKCHLLLAMAILAAAGSAASAEPLKRITTQPGRLTSLDYYYSLNVDCSLKGEPALEITKSPQHGELSMAVTENYPNFAKNTTYHRCNKWRVPTTQLYYRSAPSYTGYDAIAADISFPDGETSTATFEVWVANGPLHHLVTSGKMKPRHR